MPIKKILILAANPVNTSRLELDQEVREIDLGLRRSKKRDFFDLQQRWAVRTRDLRQALLDIEPQLVHFCGHGTSEGGLVLENDKGEQQLVKPEAVADLFALCSKHVECVLLNACYSEIQAEAINQHINYVIGMNQAIGDRAAIEFAVGFYEALGSGRGTEDAYKFGCNALMLEGISEYLTPILKRKYSANSGILSSHWNNEAYVSLHLVQGILEMAALPRRSLYSHWYPQFKIKTTNVNVHGTWTGTTKPVDFLVKDNSRDIEFLIEVKAANNRIDDKARFQLRMYLEHSNIKIGLLVDPFSVEIYEYVKGCLKLKSNFKIDNPEQIQPISDFLRSFLDSIANANNSNSYI